MPNNGDRAKQVNRKTLPVSLTIGAHVLDHIAARTSPGKRSAALSAHLKRYYELMQESAPEALARIDSLGQIICLFEIWGNVPSLAGVHDAKHHVSVDVSDTWARHSVSRPVTQLVISRMPDVMLLALLDLCEIYWASQDNGTPIEITDVISAVAPNWKGLSRR